ncbi:ribosomal protein S5 domain 2-like protein, partial [Ramicandelaber brevisporus]
DIDFYSQRAELQRRGLPTTTDSLRTLAKFTATRSPLRSVNKTGLGSSAAMTTSVVAALLHHFGVVDLAAASAEHTALVHNVAQLCHCLAQGKIGSGFDVSAAVYGSHIYRRFSPQLITAASDPTAAPSAADIARLVDPSATAWDCQVTPFALPKGLRLVMADVEMGSNTPSMASKVLKWRREHPDQAEPHWHALAAANERAWQLLGELGRFAEEASYADQEGMQQQDSQQHGAQQTPQGCAIGGHLQLIHDAFQAVRRLLKQMGDFAGVPIEPDAQTALLDACI